MYVHFLWANILGVPKLQCGIVEGRPKFQKIQPFHTIWLPGKASTWQRAKMPIFTGLAPTIINRYNIHPKNSFYDSDTHLSSKSSLCDTLFSLSASLLATKMPAKAKKEVTGKYGSVGSGHWQDSNIVNTIWGKIGVIQYMTACFERTEWECKKYAESICDLLKPVWLNPDAKGRV